jgi:poly(A) polymerase
MSEAPAGATASPVGALTPQPWMTAAETRTVIEALSAAGCEVRFIGGCVRDALLRRPVNDIDVAVPLPPLRVTALLERAGIRVVPTGIDHGTVTAVVEHTPFEITTLRIDVETDGRRARVAFTDDWVADAARRDLTINALSCTPDGRVYDYFGGLEDLGHGRIRFVGDPRERIAEDRLRLLRFFRFYAHYGRPPPDAEALAACREHARGLTLLSGERVRAEILRTLMAPDPAEAFQLMRTHEVLQHVLPEAGPLERLRLLTWLDTRAVRIASVTPDPVRRLAALLDTDGAGIEAVADRLRLSTRQRQRLAEIAVPAMCLDADSDERTVRRALHRLGPDIVRDLALLAWAGELAETPRLPHARTEAWIALIEAAAAWRPVTFPLKGRDVLELGLPHGPDVGDRLAEVERWWEDEDYRPDRAACLDRLRTIAGPA